MAGNLFIVAAPSGSGKTSLVKALLEREPTIHLSISYTSRAPRPGEVDGVHYHFVSRDVFEKMAANGEFFEYAVVHGDLKGTARCAVEPFLKAGRDVLLEIDWQGARKVRDQIAATNGAAAAGPAPVGIFILPPSRTELERRLRHRAQDSEATIQRRLADSRVEIPHVVEFDYVVINEEFEEALCDLVAIVRSQRLRRVIHGRDLDALVAQLTA